jgi:hypothetical protein
MTYADLQKRRAAANKTLEEQREASEREAAELRKLANRSWYLGGNVVLHFVAPVRVPPPGDPMGGVHFTANKVPGLMEEPEAPMFSASILYQASDYMRQIEAWLHGEQSDLPPSTFTWLGRKGFR